METKLHITVEQIIKYRRLVIKLAYNSVKFESSPEGIMDDRASLEKPELN